MGRTVLLNSASGGALTSSGLSLDDVSTTFDVPKLLHTKTVSTGDTFIDIPNLDFTTYERIYVKMQNFGCTATTYIEFGGMSGSARWTSHVFDYGGYQCNGSNRSQHVASTTKCYTNAQSTYTHGSVNEYSRSVVEWNFFPPLPTSTAHEITGNFYYMPGTINSHQTYTCWGGFTFQKQSGDTHADGIFFGLNQGTFKKHAHADFLTLVYGYKRRAAA